MTKNTVRWGTFEDDPKDPNQPRIKDSFTQIITQQEFFEQNKMADNAGKGKWSDAENYSLVYQIVQQLVGDGKVIKFDQINIPGRTARALSERWNKIKTDVDAAGISSSGPPGQKQVRAPRTPKKKLADVEPGAEGEDGVPAPKKAKTPRKKKAVAVINDENAPLDDQNDEEN